MTSDLHQAWPEPLGTERGISLLSEPECKALGGQLLKELTEGDRWFGCVALTMYCYGLKLADAFDLLTHRLPHLRIDEAGVISLLLNRSLVPVLAPSVDLEGLVRIPLLTPGPLLDCLRDQTFVEQLAEAWVKDQGGMNYRFDTALARLRRRLGPRITKHVLSATYLRHLDRHVGHPLYSFVWTGARATNYPVLAHYLQLDVSSLLDAQARVYQVMLPSNVPLIRSDLFPPVQWLGGPLPTANELRDVIHTLQAPLRRRPGQDITACLAYRNQVAVYTHMALMFSTGVRPVRDVFASPAKVAADTGYLAIEDKAASSGRVTRLVALPRVALQQLSIYQAVNQSVASRIWDASSDWDPDKASRGRRLAYELCRLGHPGNCRLNYLCIVSVDTLRPRAITTKDLILSPRYPANIARKWCASVLHEEGIPLDWVEAILGHQTGRHHPIGARTDVPREVVLTRCAAILGRRLEALGFTAIPPKIRGGRPIPRPIERMPRMPSGDELRAQRRDTHRHRVSDLVRAHVHVVLSPTSCRGDRRKKIHQAWSAIETEAACHGWSPRECRRTFVKVFNERERELGLTPTYISARVPPREASPYSPSLVPDINLADTLRDRFPSYLSRAYGHGVPDLKWRLAEIVMSAALFGGLCTSAKLRALICAVSANQVSVIDGVLFVDLDLENKGVQRWYADDITADLIIGRLRLGGEVVLSEVSSALSGLITKLVGRKWKSPLTTLARVAASTLAMRARPWVHRLAVSDRARSPSRRQYQRLCEGAPLEVITATAPEPPRVVRSRCSPPLSTADAHWVFERYGARMAEVFDQSLALGLSHHKTRAVLLDKLRALDHEVRSSRDYAGASEALLRAVIYVAIDLCEHGGVKKKHLAPKTISKYVQQLRDRLLPLVVDRNPEELAAEDWTSVYDQALQNASPSSTLYSNLRRLHAILEDYWMVEARPDWNRLATTAGVESEVPQREPLLLSEREYTSALLALLRSELPSRLRLQVASALILAYRCGLRRGEIWGVCCSEISLEDTHPYVIVRRAGRGPTKTRAAVRLVRPIPSWLDIEKKVLGELCGEVLMLPGSGIHSRLMSAGSPGDLVDDHDVCAMVLRVLRSLDGLSMIRLHDLRHTYVSRAFLQYALSIARTKDTAYDAMAKIGRRLGIEDPASRCVTNMRTLLKEIGHETVGTSIDIYNRLGGEVLRLLVPDGVPRMKHRARAYCLQIKDSAVRQWASRGVGRDAWLKGVTVETLQVRSMPSVSSSEWPTGDSAHDGPVELSSLHRVLVSGRGVSDADPSGSARCSTVMAKVITAAKDIEIKSGYCPYGIGRNPEESSVTESREMRCNRKELVRIDNFLSRVESVLCSLPSWSLRRLDQAMKLWMRGKRRGAGGVSFRCRDDLLRFGEGLEIAGLAMVRWDVRVGGVSIGAFGCTEFCRLRDISMAGRILIVPTECGELGTQKCVHRVLFLICVWVQMRVEE